MPNVTRPLPAPASADPITKARALAAMAVGLGNRARRAHRMGSVTDRRAAVYVNSLVRHAARLLQNTSDHDVPVLWPGSQGPGGNAAHFVLRHDRLVGPPAAHRFLAVGTDAHLRCCVMSEVDGTRLWADYSVSTAPEDLPLRVVLDALSELIAKLERAVTQLETTELTRELQLDAEIAAAKARVAGLALETPARSKQPIASEEPSRPWSRHAHRAAAEQAPTPAISGSEAAAAADNVDSADSPDTAEPQTPAATPAAVATAPAITTVPAPPPTPPPAPAPEPAARTPDRTPDPTPRPPLPSIVPAARRPLKLTRLKKTI